MDMVSMRHYHTCKWWDETFASNFKNLIIIIIIIIILDIFILHCRNSEIFKFGGGEGRGFAAFLFFYKQNLLIISGTLQ
jgi:hypothetical protein